MHLDDLRSGAPVLSVSGDGSECELGGHAPGTARLAQNAGRRVKPRSSTTEAYVADEGDRQTVLSLEYYEHLKLLADLDDGDNQLYSLGSNPLAVTLSDERVTFGSGAEYIENGSHLHADGDVRGGHLCAKTATLTASIHPQMAGPPIVTGCDNGFKVAFTLSNQAAVGNLTVVTLARGFTFAVAVVGFISGAVKKMTASVSGSAVSLDLGEAMAAGAYELSVIVMGSKG